MLKTTRTERGFLIAEFEDVNGLACSIQESSAICWEGEEEEGDYLWLGISKTEIKSGPPWVDYKLPDNVHVFTRMHLRQSHVKELLPLLQHFAEHGVLPGRGRDEELAR